MSRSSSLVVLHLRRCALTLAAPRVTFFRPAAIVRTLSTTATPESRLPADAAGSHSDFAPKSKAQTVAAATTESDTDAKSLIQSDVSSNLVFLYMKGNPNAPRCGFSANVVRILQHLGAPFSSRDVLEDVSVREAVKSFSDWPTLPQLYVKGEFVGGSDIVTQMFKSGELEKVLADAGAIKPASSTPPQQSQQTA